jgi:hypothetical protein
MSPEFIAKAVGTLVAAYGTDHVRVGNEGTRTLVRIHAVDLYDGCQPPTTPMMLVLDPSQPKPLPYVQTEQLLRNGKAPRSTSAVIVGGESWMQFSFNIPWEEPNGIMRFVAAARQRFAQDD